MSHENGYFYGISQPSEETVGTGPFPSMTYH